jgi:hypothetical protein
MPAQLTGDEISVNINRAKHKADDLDVFKTGEYTFSAQVTGVAATVGAAAKANYQAGMIVFITTDSGLMVDASLGGQKFRYVPKIASE